MNGDAAPAVTREALASFILRAITGLDSPAEWQHFMVAHYRDQEMEKARRECVRLIAYESDGKPDRLTAEEIDHLKTMASALT